MRAQAAMEFLVTYGWAIMAVIVAIAALAYFGIINPARFTSEQCLFQQEFVCREFIAELSADESKANLTFVLLNNVGNSLSNVRLSATVPGETSSFTCTPSPASIGAGLGQAFTCADITNPQGFPAVGNKQRFLVNGTYQKTNGQYNHTIPGEIYVNLQ